jgi:hypothetical protein
MGTRAMMESVFDLVKIEKILHEKKVAQKKANIQKIRDINAN